jgi:flagellin
VAAFRTEPEGASGFKESREVAFTINTNIASLQAQEYLRLTSDFQSKTINRVTSGLRIVNAGDDAAGLAIANGFRSDQAVLNQGIRNANDGLATLQTIDGGISNISKLLDRARTLAAQSSSGTFTGSRDVLNSEFTNVLSEIDRQAQAIGLNVGGKFAKNLSVFIGGGRTAAGDTTGAAAITNGSVAVDLSVSTVDTASFGLSGNAVAGVSGLDNATTFSTALASQTSMSLIFHGAGFSDANAVSVTVNLTGVQDLAGLKDAINAGIAAAASGTTASAVAFRNAGIKAQLNAAGDSFQLVSTSSAFSVQEGDGNAARNFLGTTAADVAKTAGGLQSYDLAWGGSIADGSAQILTLSTVDEGGTIHKVDITLDDGVGGSPTTIAEAVANINSALQNSNDAYLKKLVANADGDGTNKIALSGVKGFNVTIGVLAGATGVTGDGATVSSSEVAGGVTADISTQTSAQNAVNALADAVIVLGQAQAVVGKGQNQFTYAVSLASTQLTNLAASESRIRDADLAYEAANLTKAQILQQAGIAAMAQANSAPQAILSLLRG